MDFSKMARLTDGMKEINNGGDKAFSEDGAIRLNAQGVAAAEDGDFDEAIQLFEASAKAGNKPANSHSKSFKHLPIAY